MSIKIPNFFYKEGCTAPKRWSVYKMCLRNIFDNIMTGVFFVVDEVGVPCHVIVGMHNRMFAADFITIFIANFVSL